MQLISFSMATHTHLVIYVHRYYASALSLLPPFASCLIRKSRIYPKGMLAFYFIIYITLLTIYYSNCYPMQTYNWRFHNFSTSSYAQLSNTRFIKITTSVLLPENDFTFFSPPFFHSFILCNFMFIRQLNIFFFTDTLFVIFNIIERIIK